MYTSQIWMKEPSARLDETSKNVYLTRYSFNKVYFLLFTFETFTSALSHMESVSVSSSLYFLFHG